jgi:hypothetical protein
MERALDAKERESSGFRYQYSVYQFEYSRNLIFQQRPAMVQAIEALVDRNRVRMNVDTLKVIIVRKSRPYATKRRKLKHWQVTVERRSYDLTIFKVHCDQLALKIYSKGERVLRVESMIRNTFAPRNALSALTRRDRGDGPGAPPYLAEVEL